MTAYERLLELARLESELTLDPARWEELETLAAERRQLIAALPERPPAEARSILVETAAIVADNEARLSAGLREVQAELAHLGRGRKALSAYGSTTGLE